MKTNRSFVFKSAAILCLLVLIAGAGAGLLEAGRCFDAFIRCGNDPFVMGTLTGGAYCLNGYMFCLKFIEPPK
jgi:hypothetical protein